LEFSSQAMAMDRSEQILWLDRSGLPKALNRARANGWLVFKTLAELDCRANARPGVVEISMNDLAERCGLEAGAVAKIVEALRKKKLLRCYLPDHDDEDAFIEIVVPLATPIPPDEVARQADDPVGRDARAYRYARPAQEPPPDAAKIQAVVDLYLNRVSQKMNAFILEQLQMIAARFDMEAIERTVERAAKHEVRSIGWIFKELIREGGQARAGGKKA
jgi:DNA-binding Lrp family transcriptional regulator